MWWVHQTGQHNKSINTTQELMFPYNILMPFAYQAYGHMWHNATLQASKLDVTESFPIFKTILCYFHIEFACNSISAYGLFNLFFQ